MGTMKQACLILVGVLVTGGWALKVSQEAEKRVIIPEQADDEEDVDEHEVGGYGDDDDLDNIHVHMDAEGGSELHGGGYGGSQGGSYGGSHGGSFGGSYDGGYEGSHDGSYKGSYGEDYGGSLGGSYGDSYGGSYGGSHGGGYGGHGKATSYQKLTIHSAHPVKVYVKGHEGHGGGHGVGGNGVYGSFVTHGVHGGSGSKGYDAGYGSTGYDKGYK